MHPPIIPKLLTTFSAEVLSFWYALSGSVREGATTIDSPVWTPIGSRFSIEQTIIALSSLSLKTSNSNSNHPKIDSSTSNCLTGDSANPLPAIISSSSLLYAMPPPVPPRVNAGLTTTG